MTLISIFFAPVCTTSSKLFTVSLMASSRERSSLWFFSRNSRTVFDDLPMALACLEVSTPFEDIRRRSDAYLPLAVDPTWLSLIELGFRVVGVKADDECRDSERPDTSGLRVFLSDQFSSVKRREDCVSVPAGWWRYVS